MHGHYVEQLASSESLSSLRVVQARPVQNAGSGVESGGSLKPRPSDLRLGGPEFVKR
jgi:hypothetical protein